MKRNLTLRNIMMDYATVKSRADMIYLWETFYTMHALNYITGSTWLRFFNECSHWYFDYETSRVCTERNEEKILISMDYIETVSMDYLKQFQDK